jgi:predicted peptidase
MKVTDHIRENAFGNEVTYRMYEPENGSKNFVIFLHGIGECGPIDGSQLNKVEAHGYPQLIKAGAEYPFNVIAPQVAVSYSVLKKFILPYIKLKYGANKIIVTGLSLGGMATYELVTQDDFKLIDAIAPVCGKLSPLLAPAYPELDIWAFHGDKDTTVPFAADKAFVDAYNASHKKQIKFSVYVGVAHNAWDFAYRTDTIV